MMTNDIRISIGSITLGIALLGSGLATMAEATILAPTRLEDAQQVQGSLIHQYTFAPTATDDKEGTADLTQKDVTPTAATISFADEKVEFTGNNDTDGRYLQAVLPNIPQTMTLEFMMRPVVQTGADQAHLIRTQEGGQFRYYVSQFNNNTFGLALGNSSSFQTFLAADDFHAGEAYYIALRLNYDEVNDDWLVDAFVGNSTRQTFTQVWDDQLYNTGIDAQTGWSGKWNFAANNTDYRWEGELDAIAFYNTAISDATIQSHFLLTIPEPSTIFLLLSGGGMLWGYRRMRR